MRVTNVLKILTLGLVVGAGGLVVKNQQDEINNLRQGNDALVKRLDDNELGVAVWKEEQTKQFTNTLEDGLKTIRGATDKQALSNKLGVFENTSSRLDGRITKLEKTLVAKTDNQKRIELVENVLPSIVDIVALTPKGHRKVTGSVIDDRRGNLVVLTAGHYVDSESEFLKTTFQIHFKNGFIFEINGNRMPDRTVPWSSGNYRDFSVIRLTDDMQTLLRKHGIRPIPILSITTKLPLGSEIVAFGNEGKVIRGVYSRTNYYSWQGRWRTDYQTDAPIKRGDSGGPITNLDGKMVGIASWGYKPDVTITGPKELAGKLKVEVDALTGEHFLISNVDLLRGLGSIGYPLTKNERTELLGVDLVDDRPHLLGPPAPPVLGQAVPVNLLTYLSQLSELDGYAFRK